MAYITLADLKLFVPDLDKYYTPANIGDVDLLIAEGEAFVIRYFENIWYPQAIRNFYEGQNQNVNIGGQLLPQLDLALLNTTLLKNLFVYRTLGWYVCPSLMKSSDVALDSFASKGEFFRGEYDNELLMVSTGPVYDFNRDGNFNNIDKTSSSRNTRGVRAVRA